MARTDGDSNFCADPCVVKDGDIWVMFYYGYDGCHAQDGIAFSEDLIHWEKYEKPIIKYGKPGEIDVFHAHKPSVVEKDGCLYHFYCAVREARKGDKGINLDPTVEAGETNRQEYRCISVAVNTKEVYE